MRRLGRALRSFFLFPTIYFAVMYVIGLRAGMASNNALMQSVLETIYIALLPLIAVDSTYFSTQKLITLNTSDYILMTGSIIVVWVAGSVLLWFVWKTIRDRTVSLLAWQKWLLRLAVLAAIIVWFVYPLLPSPGSAEITVDFAQSMGAMPNHHRGFSQGGEGQMQDAGYFEAGMAGITPLDPTIVRIDHIFDYYKIYTIDENGTPAYDWTELDRVVDAIVDAGAEPLMSLSYTPPALAQGTVYGAPNDLAAWEELVYQTVYHLNTERELEIRYWEVWNEPNLEKFWNTTIGRYLDLYQATARGVKRADPSALVGGPGLSSSRRYGRLEVLLSAEHAWVEKLANFTIENDLPLDFISWHLYSANPDDYTRSINQYAQWLDDLGIQAQLLLTEWNLTGGSSPKLDNGETAAYLAATIARLSDSALDQAFFFEPIDGQETWRSSWGLIRADGVEKPAFYAFQLLSALSGERVTVDSSHPNVGGLATHDNEAVAIVLWNYQSGHSTVPVELTLSGLSIDTPLEAEIYGVDDTYGNAYYQPENITLLIETVELNPGSNGEAITLNITVPEDGIRLIEFTLP